MKKIIVFSLVLTLGFALLAGCFQPAKADPYSDEMKIPYSCDLSPEDGADSVERQGDHTDSPYFKAPDFYNLESTDSLTILTHFKTQQQTSEWSCGVSSALMILNWYDALGDHNEETLAQFRDNGLEPGATREPIALPSRYSTNVGSTSIRSASARPGSSSTFTFATVRESP